MITQIHAELARQHWTGSGSAGQFGFKGMTILAAQDKQLKRAARTSRSSQPSKQPETALESPIGDALRSVYQKTVEEAIPQEFLDILGKLN